MKLNEKIKEDKLLNVCIEKEFTSITQAEAEDLSEHHQNRVFEHQVFQRVTLGT